MKSGAAQKRKILIIDDDADLRRLLALDLERDFIVTQSGNWLDARRLLTEGGFDLILLDLLLPDVENPLEPLSGIRAVSLDVPVILISGHGDAADDLIDRLMRLGVDTVLRKPFTREDMLAAIAARLPR